jgi:DNA-directed RNA polymerase specialized sigma24 family protein
MSPPLRLEEFEALLHKLGPSREDAAVRYEELRRRLTVLLRHRGCTHPEELVDETLDRVARKLLENGSVEQMADPTGYIYKVAWNVARESFKKQPPCALPEAWDPPLVVRPEADETERVCLDRCLAGWPLEERELLLRYHQGERQAKIQNRADLARALNMSPNGLRLKVHRLTERLRSCVFDCVDAGRS